MMTPADIFEYSFVISISLLMLGLVGWFVVQAFRNLWRDDDDG